MLAQPKITSLASDIHTIDVAWTEDEALKPESYEVQYRKSSEKTYTTYGGEINGARATINGLDANSTYYVRVVAKGDGYETLDSKTNMYKTVKTKPLVKLIAPTITSVQTTDESLTVNWTADENAASVAVVCKRAGTSQTQTIVVDPSETHYTIDNLVQGGKYYVHVVPYGDHITTADSPSSAKKTVALAKSPKATATAILDGTTTKETIKFNWEKVEGAAGYEISYSVVGGGVPSVISVAESEDHYTIEGLAPQTSYYVQVRALGADGVENSDYCPPVKFTTEEKDRLATPTNFQAYVGVSTVDLQWRADENATGGYTISYGEVGSASPTTINVEASKTSYQISGLQSGREYAITLCANGDESVVPSQPAEVFVRTNEKLDKPTVLYSHSEGYNVSIITLKKITLVWNPVYGASGYMVEFGVQGGTSTETRRVSGGSSSSYTIDELPPTGYRMRVKALYDADSNADSDFSDWITL